MKVPQQLSDPISENLQKLAALFPAAVKDGMLDVESLREELGDFAEVQPGDEKYELNWVGKQAAKKKTFEPLLGKTLALKDDGKNSDTTQNIYIEGDNLEALKLLRQNYYGEVKMIYIDPPYNTGEDFVYTDKFTVSEEESEQGEGSVTVAGERLMKNEKSSNRFHARWFDMMYPRLKLAKDLLRADGVIFISIDDGEVANLVSICHEIFGEKQFIGDLIWQSRTSISDDHEISKNHNHTLIYANNRSTLDFHGNPLNIDDYENRDNDPRGPWKLVPLDANKPGGDTLYEIENPTTGEQYLPPKGRSWAINETSFKKLQADGRIKFGVNDTSAPKRKLYIRERIEKGDTVTPSSIMTTCGTTQHGTREVSELFNNKKVFSYPKPSSLILQLLNYGAKDQSSIILDFFSGSASTAHAVMQLNAEDGGKRKHIMVQLPEVCDPKSEAAKADYKTIAEIGKERIRRAGEKIVAELRVKKAELEKKGELELDDQSETNPYILNPDSLDIGFKSFRIEDTKINWLKKDLRGEEFDFDTADISDKDALDFVPGTTDHDVVYELMLRQSNIPLTQPITQPVPSAKRTYLYGDAYLICLEEEISTALVASLAALEPTPLKYFFRDSAFGKDIALKDETFRRLNAEIAKNTADQADAYTVEFI